MTSTTVLDGRTLRAGEFAAGGMSHSDAPSSPYGTYSMDLRANRSSGTRVNVLLWGEGSWPAAGELDFFEIGARRADRQSVTMTNHYARSGGGHAQTQVSMAGDFTQWHRFKVRWAPGLYEISIDGRIVQRFTSNVPNNAMHLVVQTAIEGGSPAASGTTTGYVDIKNLTID